MQLLLEERACQAYIDHVLGLTNWAHSLAKNLKDASVPYTSDYLMRMHFTKKTRVIEDFLSNGVLVAAFHQLHPTRIGLLAAGAELIASFARLHTVRWDVAKHHARPDMKDVHNYLEDLTVGAHGTDADIAAMMGLNAEQLATWRSHVCPDGYLHLSTAERHLLSDAIVAEFGRV